MDRGRPGIVYNRLFSPLTRITNLIQIHVVRQNPRGSPAKVDDYDTPEYDNSILIITFGRLF